MFRGGYFSVTVVGCQEFDMSELTQILQQIETGETGSSERLFELIYEELRTLAAIKLASEAPGQTLQPTALVHEAWLRLGGGQPRGTWQNREHFFAAAAEAMRRILVDAARRKKRQKHGGDHNRIPFVESLLVAPDDPEDLVSLDTALTHLSVEDSQSARLVELRYFAGLTIDEAADILQISPRTANRLWGFARAWLYRELTEGCDTEERSPSA
jgi:RNA polymerase sigma factor (TIGR02999 family)